MQRSTRRRRLGRGFTLVELLVVISIIGILVGLLLPAVQAAREAGRAMQCKNNLKQIGLALQLHHDAFNKFPPAALAYRTNGTIVLPSDAEPSRTQVTGGWGWGTYILPFLEQGRLHDKLGPDGPNFPPNPNDLTRTPLAMFLCPSEGNGPLHTALAMGGDGNGNGHARSSYAAICGSGSNADYANKTPSYTRGTMWYNSAVGIKDVLDGTSNTLMVVERFWDGGTSESRRGALWVGKVPGGPNDAGNKYTTMVRVENHPNWLINGLNNNSAASNHGGKGRIGTGSGDSGGVVRGGYGVHGVAVDGSVRFMSDHMDGYTWQRAGQIADGAMIQTEF